GYRRGWFRRGSGARRGSRNGNTARRLEIPLRQASGAVASRRSARRRRQAWRTTQPSLGSPAPAPMLRSGSALLTAVTAAPSTATPEKKLPKRQNASSSSSDVGRRNGNTTSSTGTRSPLASGPAAAT